MFLFRKNSSWQDRAENFLLSVKSQLELQQIKLSILFSRKNEP